MPDPLEVAWQRTRTMAEKLVQALDELDDVGGLGRLAGTWKPAQREKAKAVLAEARKALEGASAQLKQAGRSDSPGPDFDARKL